MLEYRIPKPLVLIVCAAAAFGVVGVVYAQGAGELTVDDVKFEGLVSIDAGVV